MATAADHWSISCVRVVGVNTYDILDNAGVHEMHYALGVGGLAALLKKNKIPFAEDDPAAPWRASEAPIATLSSLPRCNRRLFNWFLHRVSPQL